MKHFFPLASVLLLSSGLAAQLTLTGKTATAMGAKVACGSNSDAKTIKAGTALGRRGLRVSAAVRRCGFAGSSVSGFVGRSRRTGRAYSAARVSISGSIFAKGTAQTTGAKDGSHTAAFAFGAKTTTKGKFSISLGGFASSGGAAAVKVTIGKKSWSWKSGARSVRASMNMALGTKPVMVMIQAAGKASLKNRRDFYRAGASVTFVADSSTGGGKCTITKGVEGCGPALAGTSNSSSRGHLISLKLTKAAKSSLGLVLVSRDGKTFKVGKCPLFMRPFPIGVFRTDRSGAASHRLFIRARTALTIYVQDVTLGFGKNGVELATSNSLKIACTK